MKDSIINCMCFPVLVKFEKTLYIISYCNNKRLVKIRAKSFITRINMPVKAFCLILAEMPYVGNAISACEVKTFVDNPDICMYDVWIYFHDNIR